LNTAEQRGLTQDDNQKNEVEAKQSKKEAYQEINKVMN